MNRKICCYLIKAGRVVIFFGFLLSEIHVSYYHQAGVFFMSNFARSSCYHTYFSDTKYGCLN